METTPTQEHERPVFTAIQGRRAAAATLHTDPDLVIVAFFEVEPDGTALVGEVRISPHGDKFSEEDLRALLEQWSGNDDAAGISLSFVRQLALGSLDSAVSRRIQSERQGLELIAPDLSQIQRIVQAGHRLGFRNTRDARSHLRQVLVAEKYVQAVIAGQESPTGGAAQASGLKPQQVARLLILARKHGYLTSPPVRGKAGGYLTRKTAELLYEANNVLREEQ